MKYEKTKAVLVGVCTADREPEEVQRSLAELERLLETAEGVCCGVVLQNKETPDVRTYLGSGKVQELSMYCRAEGVELAVFDAELTPSQIRNLEDALGGDVRVIDRSMLILDIFALHAVTKEGKLQVELAQLKYTAPRLMGKGAELSRLGGGIGTRGPGESKLETDRRYLKRRLVALEAELAELEQNRRTMRSSRERSGIPKVAIVGYTNAGKSTLLNRLTDAGILAEDKLFATLDPTTRKFSLPSGERLLLTDTVGFIRNLPHQLIRAFRSTLDEVVYADALMLVLDISDSEFQTCLEVTEGLLKDLNAADKPTLYVFNKCDKGADSAFYAVGVPAAHRHTVSVSARTGQGMEQLLEQLQQLLYEGKRTVTFHIPNRDAGVLNRLYQSATVEHTEYGAEEIVVTAVVDGKIHGMLKQYDPEWSEPEEQA